MPLGNEVKSTVMQPAQPENQRGDSLSELSDPTQTKAFWEREDVLAELPVKPPLKPGGHYDYSVPGYQKLDVCPWIYREKLYRPALKRHELFGRTVNGEGEGCVFQKDLPGSRIAEYEFLGGGTYVVNQALRRVKVSQSYGPRRRFLVPERPLKSEKTCFYVEETPIGIVFMHIQHNIRGATQAQVCDDAEYYFNYLYRKAKK